MRKTACKSCALQQKHAILVVNVAVAANNSLECFALLQVHPIFSPHFFDLIVSFYEEGGE